MKEKFTAEDAIQELTDYRNLLMEDPSDSVIDTGTLMAKAMELFLRMEQALPIQNVVESDDQSAVSRTGELHSLHIAAYMDIDKTTESLKDMLRYKKEAAEQMLRCSDEKMCEQLAQVIKHADQLIQTVLGMYVP